MFIKETYFKYKGKKCINASIVEGYRDVARKVRHRLIVNLGPIKNQEDRIRYRHILEDLKRGEEWVKLKDLKFCDQTEFGLLYFSKRILRNIDILGIFEEVFSKTRIKEAANIFFGLISNRLCEPCSDLSFTKWFEKNTSQKFTEQKVYRFLSYLYSKKEEIEDKIFELLKTKGMIDTKVVFYDLTSSYFESTTSEIADYGYSRDEKSGKKQIVIGIVLFNKFPIATYVFRGNTQDKTTLSKFVDQIRNRFKVKECIVISDTRNLIN